MKIYTFTTRYVGTNEVIIHDHYFRSVHDCLAAINFKVREDFDDFDGWSEESSVDRYIWEPEGGFEVEYRIVTLNQA